MLHVVSEENHNKYSRYNRSVGRDRNMDLWLCNNTKLKFTFGEKVSLMLVLTVRCYLIYIYIYIYIIMQRFLDLGVLIVKTYKVPFNHANSLWLLKVTKYKNCHKFIPFCKKHNVWSKHLRSILNFRPKVSDCTKHGFGFKFPSLRQCSLCYWNVNISFYVNLVKQESYCFS